MAEEKEKAEDILAELEAEEKAQEKIIHTRSESEEEAALRSMIEEADVDVEEWEKVYLGIKEKGNYFDLVRNMYPFKLPEECERAQDRKEKKYGWPSADMMSSRCDASRLIFWTPVNRANHPDLAGHLFNKHGGIFREGHYLCYMPWRMHEARNEIQKEAAEMPTRELEERAQVETEVGGHFDPTEGGTKGASRSGDEIKAVGEDTHPDSLHEEAGEYV